MPDGSGIERANDPRCRPFLYWVFVFTHMLNLEGLTVASAHGSRWTSTGTACTSCEGSTQSPPASWLDTDYQPWPNGLQNCRNCEKSTSYLGYPNFLDQARFRVRLDIVLGCISTHVHTT
jgi:hypothetical protein